MPLLSLTPSPATGARVSDAGIGIPYDFDWTANRGLAAASIRGALMHSSAQTQTLAGATFAAMIAASKCATLVRAATGAMDLGPQFCRGRWAALLTASLVITGCASTMPGADYPRSASVALAEPEDTRLGLALAALAATHGDASGFRIVTPGADGFLARAEMIDAAEKTLDLQYFIFRGDQTGKLLTDGLLRAADRGVRVRVLVDDGDTIPGDEQIAALAAHPQVEVRIFNPFSYRGHSSVRRALEFLLHSQRLDYRMHNKLIVSDNSLALVGGRNVGTQYFQVDPESQFADDDVFAAGPIAKRLSDTFDEFWNSRFAVPVAALGPIGGHSMSLRDQRERARWHPSALTEPTSDSAQGYVTRIASGEPYAGLVAGRLALVWASAQVVCDSPDKKLVDEGTAPGRLLMNSVRAMIRRSNREVLVVTPYLVPADEELSALRELRRRNVTVRIVTNSFESNTDVLAHAGYSNFRRPLLEYGVQLYEVRSRIENSHGSGQPARLSRFGHYGLHGKLIVFDRERLFVGSMNLDQRSKHLNTEVGLLIESSELAEQTATRFESMVQPESAYSLSLRHGGGIGASRIVWTSRENGEIVERGFEPGSNVLQRVEVRFLASMPLSKEL